MNFIFSFVIFIQHLVLASTLCGKAIKPQKLESRTRIVNGYTANPNSWPWTVLIKYKDPKTKYSITCGGVLVGTAQNPNASDIVITTAHCVLDQNNKPFDPSGFTVILGNHDNDVQELAEVQAGVMKYVYHSMVRLVNNDIAILRLKTPVKFNNCIQPVCLPSAQGRFPSDPNNCYAVGWGRISNNNYETARYLQQVKLPIIQDQPCYWSYWDLYNHTTTYCAGYMDGSRNICHGDSGSPLVCPENNGWTVYGLASWAPQGQCAQVNKPGIFVRTSNYKNWIDQQINFLYTSM